MSSQVHDDATPVQDVEQLVDHMLEGAKPRARWVVGTEHEKLGWWPDRGARPTYEGSRGIGALLRSFAGDGWAPVVAADGAPLVALGREGATITLEPGGQLELSGAPVPTLAETRVELEGHLEAVRRHSEPLGIDWSGLGYMPVGEPSTAPWMPKPRYGIMRPYLRTRGRLAEHMMAMTCTVQANYDFADAEDAMRKLRVCMALSPLVYGLFANSTVRAGRLLDERCFRASIWAETDPDRCDLPLRLLEPGATLRDYVEWVLDVPVFFVQRGGRLVNLAGVPFRRLLEGWEGFRATVGDFGLHLSTLFPDVRLKQHLEVRAADMGAPAYVLALPALHLGLLYDEQALAACESLLGWLAPGSIAPLRARVARDALDAKLDGLGASGRLADVAADVLRIARDGLRRLEPESVGLLDGLQDDVEARETQADRTRASWTGDPTALLARTRLA